MLPYVTTPVSMTVHSASTHHGAPDPQFEPAAVLFFDLCDSAGARGSNPMLASYTRFPAGATDQFITLELSTPSYLEKVTLTNSRNVAGNKDGGTKAFRLETSQDLASWELFATGTLTDIRNKNCPHPQEPFTTANAAIGLVRYLKLTMESFYGQRAAIKNVEIEVTKHFSELL